MNLENKKPMKISVIKGHLTPTNKTHLKALFAHNLTHGKVNRISYLITQENEVFTVKIAQADNSIVLGEKISVSKATFKIN